MAANSITAANGALGSLVVDTLNIKGNAVTFPQYDNSNANFDYNVFDGEWRQVVSYMFEYSGDNAPVEIDCSFWRSAGTSNGSIDEYATADYRLKSRNIDVPPSSWVTQSSVVGISSNRVADSSRLRNIGFGSSAGTIEVVLEVRPISSTSNVNYLRIHTVAVSFTVLKK